ncbi:hypothetical protein DM02DRAFT_19279 [Periconia macrospinosa]|uniref:Uncharacterized protein n=1 Tax=Periconia macrospinosa TaxID=97972 RepID=A0A2V1DLS4_9PLEO|nr:hypothetical protein DM02DRAFT_19279 [Periconia macrospinosa]
MAGAAVLDDLSAHLQKVDADPTYPLDQGLLEQCELFTNTSEYQSGLWQQTSPLFLQIASLLSKLQQDPSPLVHFVIKLTEPYRFEHVKAIPFEEGLDLEATAVHSLILTLLEKAAESSNDAQALANRPTVVASIVRLWLCTRDAGVATQAQNLLTSLLEVSKNEPVAVSVETSLHTYGSGPMWRRLFNDRDINSLYYYYTSTKNLENSPLPHFSKRDKTISQARLLEWLPKVGALDWNAISTSRNSEVEREVGLGNDQGLLHYAALKMVDTEDDLLMHITLLNFYTDLITTVKTKGQDTHQNSSLSLDFLKEQGIHQKILGLHTNEEPSMEQALLGPRTALYIGNYVSHYPEDFEHSQELPVLRNYIERNIRKCEPHDLSILAAMPRATLIPQKGDEFLWNECILLNLPIQRTNPDTLKALAAVFHGPQKNDELLFPQPEITSDEIKREETEAYFARALTCLFYEKHSSLFSDLVMHAETIAMTENALASLTVLRALISANWSTTPPTHTYNESAVTFPSLQYFPKTGIDLILDPTRSGGVLPLLMKPATTFSNTVGGTRDVQDAAYRVAIAKFDVLQALRRKLEKESGRHDVLAMIARRLNQGPWGEGGSAGSRIGTLEL